eukprot:1323382-Amorphochlora_amoeboformis.AAC.2
MLVQGISNQRIFFLITSSGELDTAVASSERSGSFEGLATVERHLKISLLSAVAPCLVPLAVARTTTPALAMGASPTRVTRTRKGTARMRLPKRINVFRVARDAISTSQVPVRRICGR